MIESVNALINLFKSYGAERFYAKRLAPNDNSKNQVYLGAGFGALNIIPHGDVVADGSEKAGSKRDRAKAPIHFYWIAENGLYLAKHAQLILYPKYPEVRMSGFLKGCREAPSEIMATRDPGRVLFMAMTADGRVMAYAVHHSHPLALEIFDWNIEDPDGIFIPLIQETCNDGSRALLIAKLTEIYQKHWIRSQKLSKDGIIKPYSARNGGGYTLEAELGISPNGYAEPDYLGWEIKQYGVNNFDRLKPKSPVTLMTPEPTGGIYKHEGVEHFLRTYGYPDKSGKAGRINFGGKYLIGKQAHKDTGLRLGLTGFDMKSGKITDMEGGIALLTNDDTIAALWRYPRMIDHWKRKHSQAAYVPSMYRNPPPEYCYGPEIMLCQKTDFDLFIKAVSRGLVYYDPGIKLEERGSGKLEIKRRSQFRVDHGNLVKMYHSHESVRIDLNK